MDLHFHFIKFYINFLILCSIIQKINSVLSFIYPQATTLSNDNILVIEQNGIYICDSTFNTIVKTLHTFSEEDKITTESKLSKTIIKKSSYEILIFSNYKLFIIDTYNGDLLYNSNDKLIDVEPDYIDIASYYDYGLYFTINYLDNNNILQIKYYEFIYVNNIELIDSESVSSIERNYDNNDYYFNFQQKGLSCNYIIDYSQYDDTYYFFICFVIGNDGTDDYLLPLIIDYNDYDEIFFDDSYYTMDLFQVNDITQIKTDTSKDEDIVYICYNTNDNKASCYEFYLRGEEGIFTLKKNFEKGCRQELYGMKVTYIYIKKDIFFTCSDIDGSLQAYSFNNEVNYLKYENCYSIYGYSIIYLDNSRKYYITSDVICPEGKIPFNRLINSNDFTPEIMKIEKTSQIIINSLISEKIEDMQSDQSTVLTEKIDDNYSTELLESSHNSLDYIGGTTEGTFKNTHKTFNIVENSYISTIKYTEIFNNDCPEMCLECNSMKKCTKCNKDKYYYPIELLSNQISLEALECINETIKAQKYQNFYLDLGSESFKLCYEKCATCDGKGDGNNNNCITCEEGYILHPDFNDSKNCVPNPDPFYYIKYGQYTITNSDICPDDFSFLIEAKGKCIDQCQKDNKYIYTYDGNCYDIPPENTNDEDGDFFCKDNPNKCIATKKVLHTLNLTITNEEIEILTSKYALEYNYTNNHISIYENNIYILKIYKNSECISELGLSSKTINFEDCSNEIRTKKGINNDTNIIVVQIETKPGKDEYKRNPIFDLYHPETGKYLNYLEECKDIKITLQKNLTDELSNNPKINISDIKLMGDNGINLFDISNPFYNDICTHYPDILNKDIPLSKRVLAYYPNIELCDDNCQLFSIYYNNLTTKCKCILSKEVIENKKNDKDDFYQKELGFFEEFIYSTNINVIKCYMDLFDIKYFSKCYGSFIILGLILIQIICLIAYCHKSKFYIRKFFFSIINKYLKNIKNNKQNNSVEKYILKQALSNELNSKIYNPPRKAQKSSTIFVQNGNKKNKIILITKNEINPVKSKSKKNILIYSNNSNEKLKNNINKINNFLNSNSKLEDSNKISIENSLFDYSLSNFKDVYNINIEEFMKTDLQDMDYDEAIKRDKRTFCQYYKEKIMSEQIILDTFFNKEYLKPQPIKIMLLVLQIDLYFLINALFYNEEYITKIFELKEDSFSKAAWRFFDNLFYSFVVGVIINYIIEFFFIQEKKLRNILKNEKDNIMILKYEMIQIIKDLEKRYKSFIIISFIILVFTWYYISCFNNIYPHMKKEWIIFSVFIIISVQILSLITRFMETLIRFLGHKLKSEKLFKLSLIFS